MAVKLVENRFIEASWISWPCVYWTTERLINLINRTKMVPIQLSNESLQDAGVSPLAKKDVIPPTIYVSRMVPLSNESLHDAAVLSLGCCNCLHNYSHYVACRDAGRIFARSQKCGPNSVGGATININKILININENSN